ncbi:putative mitochondrial carrier protein [Aspergillus brunneoviolaceus CBS 621.78]|uniref:Mitochondrial carrier n=1 Tax=Aspergillus brunneoviolaceus CBS 621.78 TaxID=1450534 RepID=A0ACD1GHF3_9EURO|nr:mitochondrial carrier [Aspergillus brunneoviolaceus CBS 621.78]RAH48588.1 mitochondrial carrier [Aspergillus brunneoviolaceus CBS 621.78]
MSYEAELDSYQLYHRYEQPRRPQPQDQDWKQAALRGPALPALGNALAGAIGAALSNVATYPLSLIVARLQTQQTKRPNQQDQENGKKAKSKDLNAGDDDDDGGYAGVLDAARKIYAQEGGLGSFYTGLAQDTAKSVFDSFLFFLAYEFLRQRRIRARFGGGRGGARRKSTVLPVLDELVIGVVAGAFAKLFTTPLANIVARKQTAGKKGSVGSSTREIAARIRAEKGLRGFWSGYSASLILTLNPSLTFFLNEVLKYALLSRRRRRRDPTQNSRSLSPAVTFLLAALSKSAASAVTYPFSKAKTRAQVMGDDSSLSSSAQKASGGEQAKENGNAETDEGISFTPAIVSNVINIARSEGVAGLYAGLPAEVLKGFFSHGFTMLAKDAVYSAIVQSYYLLLIALRKYPSPEELIQRAREQAEEYADVAREGARDLAEKTKQGAEEVMHSLTAQGEPEEANLLGNNETAEMVGDYVEDDGTHKDLYHWFWEKDREGNY